MTDTPDKEWIERARKFFVTHFGDFGKTKLLHLHPILARELQSSFDQGVERERVRAAASLAAWMISHGYATGHGDTIEDLLGELEWQIAERASVLREALEPFAAIARELSPDLKAENVNTMAWAVPSVGDFRRALNALTPTPTEGERP